MSLSLPAMDRKAAIRQYKEAATPIGIVGIRNIATGKTFLSEE